MIVRALVTVLLIGGGLALLALALELLFNVFINWIEKDER